MKMPFKIALVASAIMATVAVAHANHAEQLSLPDDEGKWYFTVAGNPGYSLNGTVVNELKAKCHYRHIPENDPIFGRYAGYIGDMPAVFIQRPDGRVVYKASGKDFPSSLREMESQILNCRPLRPLPPPGPAPSPTPAPLPELVPVPDVISVDPVPDVVPTTDDSFNLLFAVLAGLGGLAGGVVPELMKGNER